MYMKQVKLLLFSSKVRSLTKMKWRSLFFLFTCLLMQKLVSGKDNAKIIVRKTFNGFEFKCTVGTWNQTNDALEELSLSYKDENSKLYECVDGNGFPKAKIFVKFRTCDNCIELDAPALSAIIVGNLLATCLIACAVYSITGQPKGKNFSGNKASDKVNLITNGDGDTYQHLTGQTSEYSRLERKK